MDPFGAVPAGDGAAKQCWGGPEMKELSVQISLCAFSCRFIVRGTAGCRGKVDGLGISWFAGGGGRWGPRITASSKILCNCLGKVSLATAGQE